MNENTNQALEPTPAPETPKTGNPPLEDEQLEDVAGGILYFSPDRKYCAKCGIIYETGDEICRYCGGTLKSVSFLYR
jgi:hypothetical protein